MTLAITIAWHLAGNQTQRRLFAGAGVVQALAAALRWTLRTAVHEVDDRTSQTETSMAVGHRDALQLRALGTLAVFMIDKVSEECIQGEAEANHTTLVRTGIRRELCARWIQSKPWRSQ